MLARMQAWGLLDSKAAAMRPDRTRIDPRGGLSVCCHEGTNADIRPRCRKTGEGQAARATGPSTSTSAGLGAEEAQDQAGFALCSRAARSAPKTGVLRSIGLCDIRLGPTERWTVCLGLVPRRSAGAPFKGFPLTQRPTPAGMQAWGLPLKRAAHECAAHEPAIGSHPRVHPAKTWVNHSVGACLAPRSD